jgi:hypothetical protein
LGRPPKRFLHCFEIPNDLVLKPMPAVANYKLATDGDVSNSCPLTREHDVIQERARTSSGYGRVAQIDSEEVGCSSNL